MFLVLIVGDRCSHRDTADHRGERQAIVSAAGCRAAALLLPPTLTSLATRCELFGDVV